MCSRQNDLKVVTIMRPESNRRRRERRQRISEMWGRNGRQDWFSAQSVCIDVLCKEGFTGVKLLTDYFGQSPFDICGFSDDAMHVFQITTRTHTDKRKQHRLARDLRLIHKVIFVSMKLGVYVIKDFSPGGLAELREEEVKSARKLC